MAQFKHTPETDQIIAAGYRNGDPVNWIAKKLRCSKNVVIGRARRIGVSNPQGAIWAKQQGRRPQPLQEGVTMTRPLSLSASRARRREAWITICVFAVFAAVCFLSGPV